MIIMREIYLSDYDIAAVKYIYDNYNKNVLFKMSDEDLHMLVYEECNILNVDSELVFCYISKERDEYNATH